MCFSEEASFSSAVIIAIIAGASLHAAGYSRLTFLALTPFFFAWQQLAEGLTWLHLNGILTEGLFASTMRRYYYFFAFIGWPIWIAFVLWKAEKVNLRKSFLFAFMLLGGLIGTYNLVHIFEQAPYAVIANHSIRYETTIPYQVIYLYAVTTLLPWFISSLKGVFLAGCVFAFSFLLAGYFYEFTMASVWCFFAAIASIVIFKLVLDNEHLKQS